MSTTRPVKVTPDMAFAVRDPSGHVRLDTAMADLDEHALWLKYSFECAPPEKRGHGLWVHQQQQAGAAIVAVRVEVLGVVEL